MYPLKGGLYRGLYRELPIGVLKGDTRSLDYSSHGPGAIPLMTWNMQEIYTLLMGLTKPQLNGMLQALETVAQAYGIFLNPAKTELLLNPARDPLTVRSFDGTSVKTTPHAKYLGRV